jgi:hypothetical protein
MDQQPAIPPSPIDTFSCRALATDFDGTLAHEGVVEPATLEALRRLRESGRKLILVTGRQFEELRLIFPAVDEFDAVVAENGAHVRWPAEQRDELLGQRPPPEFMTLLKEAGVTPIARGHVIVATFEPYEKAVLEVIKVMGLELQVIFNKGAVMVLPSGINKASGLKRVLKQLAINPQEVVAVGDAENDHAFFEYCGFSAAVANALPSVREHASWVSQRRYGGGVQELIDLILAGEPVVFPNKS